MQNLQPNTTLQGGKYRIERVLGQGGFGITYMATQVALLRKVAIKELFLGGSGQAINDRRGNEVIVTNSANQASFDQQKAKFKKEALRLANLNHPNLVKVHDLFEENGTAYYVMDYIDGESLRTKWNREGCLSEELVINYLQQILPALDAAHKQHIWHLDIKPENIMIDRDGHAYLIDFGASKHVEPNSTLTTSLALAYTPGYCPPELLDLSNESPEYYIQAIKDIGPWTDIYALGATMYNLLSDSIPPSTRRLNKEGHNAFIFPSNISSSTKDLIVWMMKPNSEDRPQSVDEIMEEISKKQTATSTATKQIASSTKKQPTTAITTKATKKIGEEIISCQWNDAEPFYEGMAGVKDSNGKWGFIDKTGKVVIPCKWENTSSFHEGLAAVKNDNGKWGFVDKTGKVVIPCKWNGATFFSEGLAEVMDVNEKKGFIDKTGKVVIPCQWEWTVRFSEGLAEVRISTYKWGYFENFKHGFIDKTGNLVIPCKWDDVGIFSEGLASVQKYRFWEWSENANGRYGFIDKTGRLVIPSKWKWAGWFTEGLAVVEKANGKYGFIDKTGRLVIPCKWEYAQAFRKGLARVRDINNRTGYIDKTGTVVIPCQWNGANDFCEGLARVKNCGDWFADSDDDKYGFIDKTGKVVIPCKWYGVEDFSEGLALVRDINGKRGFIDKTGTVVIPCQWNGALSFSGGLACVKDSNGKWGFIDKTGKVMI